MRKLDVIALLLCVSASAACRSKDVAPGGQEGVSTGGPVTPPANAAAPAGAAPAAAAATAPPAFVVYTGVVGVTRTVGATIEDGSASPVALSASGVDTTFAGVISGRRALLVEHKADKSIDALIAVRGDGEGRVSMGSLPAGRYAAVKQLRSGPAGGDGVVIEVTRSGGEAVTDVLSLRAGAAPRVLAEGSSLVAADAKRVAVMTAGDLRSMAVDGGPATPLGGRDGLDRVAEVQGARILLTMHAGSSDDVRSIGIDGGGAVDFGKPDVDESAFAFTTSARVVFSRKTAGGLVLASVDAAGKDERVLTTPAADLAPIKVTADGNVFFRAGAALLVVPSAGGSAARVLDSAVGANVQIGAVEAGTVVYRSDSQLGPALRAAKLDGTGVKSLCEGVPQIPFFAGITSSGRVVFYRSLASQQEGGRLFSINLDGTDRRPVGTGVADADGNPMIALDQDFEARTPAGRLILESEFVSNGSSQLVVATHDGTSAKLLAGAGAVRFAALIP